MLRRISLFTSNGSEVRQAVLKVGVNTAFFRIQHSTSTQHSDRKDCDVSRLAETERLRNKYSFLESFTLYCSSLILIN